MLRDTIVAQVESELAHERMQRSLLRQRVLQAAREGQAVETIVETDWDQGQMREHCFKVIDELCVVFLQRLSNALWSCFMRLQ